MRRFLFISLTALASLIVAGSAQALVVNDGGTYAGVALVPSARGNPLPSGASAVTASVPCTDPALTSDLWLFGQTDRLPDNGLCYQGGAVVHKNEMFALTWDAQRAYWSGTRGYVEQFMRDVADGSGTLSSPYAVTSQYSDGSGRAENNSVFGGGCIDYGAVGGASCEFESNAGPGHDFPASGCPATGDSFTLIDAVSPNTICLTDQQLRGQLSTMISQTGIVGRTQPGYTPVVNLLLPPGVEACLDAAGNLCSVNGSLTPPPPSVSTSTTGGTIAGGTYQVKVTYVTAGGEELPSAPEPATTSGSTSTITIDSPPPAPGAIGWKAYVTQAGGTTFTLQGSTNAIGSALTLSTLTSAGVAPPNTTFLCSYHSHVNVNGTDVAYVVQPWTVATACDEPAAPAIPLDPTPGQLATAAGLRLVSPLSQSQIATLVNPTLDSWSALDGSEIDDNHGCIPLPRGLDSVTVGSSSQNPYLLQREFNNAGVIEYEPNTYFGCAPGVLLTPAFVLPSAVNPGDEVQFDGSTTASTLIVSAAGYKWNFGDGTTATGPSVVHSYTKGGTFTVTLTVTDRGGNAATLSQTIQVLGANGQPVTSPTSKAGKGLHARIQLIPQGLRTVLRKGVMVRVKSNESANGIASVSISRAQARRVHIKLGRGPSVQLGVGTLSAIKAGTVTLHLRLPAAMVARLRHLTHLTLTVRLALVGPGGDHLAIDAAGRY